MVPEGDVELLNKGRRMQVILLWRNPYFFPAR